MAALSLKQETVAVVASQTTQQAAAWYRRLNQKKNAAIDSVPLIKNAKEKIRSFDRKLTEKWGKAYTKGRNILTGSALFFAAGYVGTPALVALGTYNAVKAIKPMIKDYQQQKKQGNVSGLIDFMKKNPKKTASSIGFATLGSATIGCGIAGAATGKAIARTGLAVMVARPEAKQLWSTIKKFTTGRASKKDVLQDSLVLSTTIGAYIAGSSWGDSISADHGILHHDGSSPDMSHGAADYSGMNHGAASVSANMGDSSGISVAIKGADKNNSRSPAMQIAALNPAADQKKGSDPTQMTPQKNIPTNSPAKPRNKANLHTKINHIFAAQLQAKANRNALKKAAAATR